MYILVAYIYIYILVFKNNIGHHSCREERVVAPW